MKSILIIFFVSINFCLSGQIISMDDLINLQESTFSECREYLAAKKFIYKELDSNYTDHGISAYRFENTENDFKCIYKPVNNFSSVSFQTYNYDEYHFLKRQAITKGFRHSKPFTPSDSAKQKYIASVLFYGEIYAFKFTTSVFMTNKKVLYTVEVICR